MTAVNALLCASMIYLVVGATIYLLGHPKRRRPWSRLGSSPEKRNLSKLASSSALYRQLGHSAQVVNFLINKIPHRRKRSCPAGLFDIYKKAIRHAFDPKRHWFITTGSPHGRACYSRNFAWFYPTLLDPVTIIDDLENRTVLMARSLETILRATGPSPLTTTLIPITAKRMAAVNYVTPPSDSLLGILAGIDQLASSGSPVPADEGARLLRDYAGVLRTQTEYLLEGLKPFMFAGTACPSLDVDENRSTATDTREGRLRFVVAANVWATIAKAVRLGVINEILVSERFEFNLTEYKRRILNLFGAEGYIRNSLDENLDRQESQESLEITL